jgi:hypothetical protein
MPPMGNTDELADLRAHLKKLERRLAEAGGETDRTQRLLVARMLVVVATVALFLSVSMPWYDAVEVDPEVFDSISGWRVFAFLTRGDEGALVFGGVYSWAVVLAALAAGAGVFQLRRRWVAVTLATLLTPMVAGHLLLNALADEGDQTAGNYCAIIVMAATAFAWGNLVAPLRDLETESLYSSRA